VLALQAGRWWAERADLEEDEQEASALVIEKEADAKRKRRKETATGSEERSPKKLQKRRAQS
jgi:hypothetical protein